MPIIAYYYTKRERKNPRNQVFTNFFKGFVIQINILTINGTPLELKLVSNNLKGLSGS